MFILHFHYVDNNYYTPSANLYNRSDDVKVIVMGALARDFEQIAYMFQDFRKFIFIYAKGEKILIICFQV